jgi:hypothetical protein
VLRNRFRHALVVALALVARSVAADEDFGPRPQDIPSVFFVARSTNRNQVHYGVRVDGACNVVGDEPVYAYWRMIEKRGEIEPLLNIEKPAYGIEDSQPIYRSVGATSVRVRLRAFPARSLVVTVVRNERGCAATATTTVAGADARLQSIYVRVKWPFGVDYVLLRGVTRNGLLVEERIRD